MIAMPAISAAASGIVIDCPSSSIHGIASQREKPTQARLQSATKTSLSLSGR